MRLRAGLGVAIGAVVLSACTADAPAEDARPSPVSLSFLQERIDEGTSRAKLRVVNATQEAVDVTGIGLQWPGYGGRILQPYETTVPGGQTLDLSLVLPEPTCAQTGERAAGLVELSEGTVVRDELDSAGQQFLERVWRRACAEQLVAERVALGYGERWQRRGEGRGSSLAGSVELVRREGDAEIRIVEMLGSVLFDVRLARPAVLAPGVAEASFPVSLTPARCDEHALGQSTQTFTFRATVEVGEAEPVTVLVRPDASSRRQALAMLYAACR